MSFKSIQQEFIQRVRGDCFFDDQTREQFATAACWYRIKPFGVIAPKSLEDVVATVLICREEGIPITARGGATGLAGQAIGSGIILDFTKHMNGVVSLDADTATVQPGLVLNNMNAELQTHGRWFPVDPTSMNLCTLGGMIATNASGWHGLKYGSTKNYVKSLSVVRSDGTILSIEQPSQSSESLAALQASLESLLRPHDAEIRARFPDVKKNSSGYNLIDAIGSHPVDLRKLIVGSEGTLALVVEATLSTLPLPGTSLGVLLYLPDYENTVAATAAALQCSPTAIEILDKSYFGLHDADDASIAELILPGAQTMLYVEFEMASTDSPSEILERFGEVMESIPTLETKVLDSELHRRAFWQLRESVSRSINLEKSYGKSSFIEDVAVPVGNMASYIRKLQRLLHAHGIAYSLYAHAGVGNIHCGAFVNLNDERHYRMVDDLASEVFALASSLGGTISGEHGDGFVRTPHLEQLYGPTVYGLFRDVKHLFDPDGLFNPGKIIGTQHASILHDIDFSRGSYET